jgi:hypothetical protein
MGKDMRGKSPLGEDYETLGRGEYWGRMIVFSIEDIFWFGFWVNCYRGAPGCWEFWARGPGILTKSWS